MSDEMTPLEGMLKFAERQFGPTTEIGPQGGRIPKRLGCYYNIAF